MSRATQNYQRIWKQDRRFFGAKGQPAPRVLFNRPTPGAAADTGPGVGGVRTIELNRGTTGAMKSNKYQNVRDIVEHEFARVYQPDSTMGATSGDAGIGTANATSNRLAHFRNTGKGNPKKYNRKHLPYFGQNPRTIRWPSS